jgi:alpha-ketoglutarate-dependent taurine dioxygenase
MLIKNKNSLSYVCPKTENIAIINSQNNENPVEWYSENIDYCKELILKSGGILFRNFDISSASEFNNFANNFSSILLEYKFRSSPRTRVGGKIYTSTEYPADRVIPLHNENSYTNNWPSYILFYCSIAATISGGETPIADSRRVYQQLNQSIIDKFEKHGVMYTRNYLPGIDLSWQEVFQTDDKLEVECFCKENDINFEWNVNGAELFTTQNVQASVTHPITKEKVWFNQAQLFHASALPKEQQKLIQEEFGLQNLPRNCFYGDGSEIKVEDLEEIKACYFNNRYVFNWQEGDILLLDNLLMAHGRNPYEGDRKILVAMG